MKGNKKEEIKTIPAGVWESSRPKKTKEEGSTTDLQGNGYPANQKDNKEKKY